MGLLDSLKRFIAECQEQATERQRKAAEAAYQTVEAKWMELRSDMHSIIDGAKTFRGLARADDSRIPLQLKKDERVFLFGDGFGLIEPRREPGHYVGVTQGFSVRIAKGLWYHAGTSHGTFVQGEERPTSIDAGTATFTNQRVVFQGDKYAREWPFAKMLGYHHNERLPWTAIHVSNRQKVSGLLYDEAHQFEVRCRFALALAHFNNSVPQFIQQVEAELAAHERNRPRRSDLLTSE